MDRWRLNFFFLMPAAAVLGLYASAFCAFILTSFYRVSSSGRMDTSHPSWNNYERFFDTPSAIQSLYDTLAISAWLTLITLVLSYPFAYLLSRVRSSVIRRVLLGVVMVTFLSGGITRAYAWMVVLGNNGLINKLIVAAGFDRIQLLYNTTGVLIALVHFLLPFCILTLLGNFQTVPRSMEEASTSLGASRVATFWKVIFPLTVRGAVGAGILTFSVAISSFLFPLLLGGGKVRMMSNHIYELIFVSFDIPFAAATAAIFLIVVIVSTVTLLIAFDAILGDRKWGVGNAT